MEGWLEEGRAEEERRIRDHWRRKKRILSVGGALAAAITGCVSTDLLIISNRKR